MSSAFNVGSQLAFNRTSFRNLDMKSVGISAISGFASGALATSPLGIGGIAVGGFAIGAGESIFRNYAYGQRTNVKSAVVSGAFSSLFAYAGGAGSLNNKLNMTIPGTKLGTPLYFGVGPSASTILKGTQKAAFSGIPNAFKSTAKEESFMFGINSISDYFSKPKNNSSSSSYYNKTNYSYNNKSNAKGQKNSYYSWWR